MLDCVSRELMDHGVPVPAATRRGVTATVDGEGRRVVLIWLMDGGIDGGTGSQLVIDVETGRARQIPVAPFAGDSPFAVLHSSRNLWYSLYGGRFYEFDPASTSFSFAAATPKRAAMSMTEDNHGVVWAALYPDAHLVSFDPATRKLVDHGQLNLETWAQYPRQLAFDDAGWIYAGIGFTTAQIVGCNPATGETRAFIAEERREHGDGHVHREADGTVRAVAPGWDECVLFDGQVVAPGARPDESAAVEAPLAAEVRTGAQDAMFRDFPDGSSIHDLNLEERALVVREPDGRQNRVTFDYTTAGPGIAVLHAGPDGKLYGSTAHPSRLFVYEPQRDQLCFFPNTNVAFKSLATQGRYVFGGHYSGGLLWRIDTAGSMTLTPQSSIAGRPVSTVTPKPDATANPLELGRFAPNVNMPRCAFAHPDGRHILISGQPDYGCMGGGLVCHDLETGETAQWTHQDLLPDYSTMAIAALPNGDLLCGTSPRGGHGTTPVHEWASLYVLDWPTCKVAWQSGPIEGVDSIQSMVAGPDGLHYCVAGNGTLLVFDGERRAVEHRASLAEYGNHTTNPAMVLGPDQRIYLALSKALVRITPETFEVEELAAPPAGIQAGLGIVNGRIYFACGSHLMSVEL